MKKRLFVILAALVLVLTAGALTREAKADGKYASGCEAWLEAALEEAKEKGDHIIGGEEGLDKKNGVFIIMPGETIAIVPDTGVAQAGIQGGISSQTINVVQLYSPEVHTEYLKDSKPEKTTFTELEKKVVPFFYGDREKDSVDYTEGPTSVEYVSLYRNDTGLPIIIRGQHWQSGRYMTTKSEATVAGCGRHDGKDGAVNFQTWHNINYAPMIWFAEPYYELKLWEKTSAGKAYEWRRDDAQTTYKVYVSHEDQTWEIDNPMVEEWCFLKWEEKKSVSSAFPINGIEATGSAKTKFTWNMQAQMTKNGDMEPRYFLTDHELAAVFLTEGRTIRFDANGGKINGKENLLVESGHDDVYTVSPKDYVPVREGYDFLGWCTHKDKLEEPLPENATAENSKDWFEGKHMNLYAAWKQTDKVEAFVKRCYKLILGRDADEGGLQGWSKALKDKTAAASQIINGFVSSDEFKNRKLSAGESVDILYNTMMDRAADEGGKAGWVDALGKGYTLQHIINGFCGSDEFAAICKGYEIEPGTVDAGPVTPQADESTPRGKIEAFVKRCYSLILNRDADEGGLKGWSDALEQRTAAAAQIIDGFVRSDEYTNRKLSAGESVDILYNTMLGRAADEGGRAGWVDALGQGFTLQHIINGFCGSAEFTAICDNYGIVAGSVAVSGAVVKREAITPEGDEAEAPVVYQGYNSEFINEEKIRAFVEHCYAAVFWREGDAEGIENYTSLILNGKKTPKSVAREFVFSAEFQGQLPGNEEFIRILYRLYFDREPGAEELAGWVKMLEDGASLEEIVDGFAGSAEFKAIVNEMK